MFAFLDEKYNKDGKLAKQVKKIEELDKKGKIIPVLGDVAAGVPILAQQDIIGYEDIPADMAKTGEYFGLKIKGDSMEPKIHDNDIVIVKSMSDAENNDIVIAMINNEATCKRLHKYSNSVVLTAINPDYKPIEVTPDENIQILGKVVMSISKF